MKRIFKFFFFLAIILLGAAIALPLVFKDRLIDQLKQEINKQVNARVDFKDAELSLLSTFPYFGLGLEGFTIDGIEDFDSIRLVEVAHMGISIDFMSVISGDDFQVEEIALNDVYLNLFINEFGKANFDIVKASDAPADTQAIEEPSSFKIALKSYSLDNFNLVYEDREGEIYTKIVNLNHQGQGDFTANIVNLSTHTDVEAFIFKMEGIRYADRLHLESDFDMSLNQEEFKFTFGENFIKANDLLLKFDGWLAMPEESIDLDMSFVAPDANFKQLLSLVPAIFYQDFESVQTQGNFKLNGEVKGLYDGIHERYPTFNFTLNLRDGSFRYPDLPAGVETINMDMSVLNTTSDLDNTKINIPLFTASILENVFRANASLSNPLSDPTYAFGLYSNFDLAALEKALPIEGYLFSGLLTADLQTSGRMSYLENERYDKMIAQGQVDLKEVIISGDSLDFPIEIPFGSLSINPQVAYLKDTKIIIGRSDFTLDGDIDNLMAYALSDSLLKGNLRMRSHYLNINELSGDEESVASDESSSDTNLTEVIRLPENIAFDFKASIDSLIYDDLVITKVVGDLNLDKGKAQLKDFNMYMLDGQLGMQGSYDSKPIEPLVDFDFSIKNFSFKQSFDKLTVVQEMVPIMKNTVGSYSASFTWASILLEDMSPDLANANAIGMLNTSPLTTNGKAFGQIATFLNNPKYNSLDLGPVALSFTIENGRIEVEPFDFKMGKYKVEASGSSGIDQSLDFTLDMNIPVSDVKASGLLSQLGSAINTIPLKVEIGGTLTNPEVRPSFGDIGNVLLNSLKSTLSNKVDVVKADAKKAANKKLEDFVKAAEEQGDKLIVEAETQAEKLNIEAAKQAQNLRNEGDKLAQKIIAEAGSNPIKQVAAKPLSAKAKSEADDKAALLERKAQEQGDNLIQAAKKKKEKLIQDARAKAQV
jgi:hypothetical protein